MIRGEMKMQKCELKHVIPTGETAARIMKNLGRLQSRCYRPGVAGTEEAWSEQWYGDWEGRTILTLALEARSLKTEPAYLDELVEWVFENCNEMGYRGNVMNFSAIKEVVLAGHNWLLRGLIEYYLWREDSLVLEKINQIVKNLYLPLRGKYVNYPHNPEQRSYDKDYIGRTTGHVISGWETSGDTGCAFISLDGLSQAYELTGNPEILELLEEMISTFVRIDFVGIHMQTHATLTACRGIMRLYSLQKKSEYLDFCERLYELYKRCGMTENYANLVHFSMPNCTEPCGIIDSFMLTISLWEATGKSSYLQDAHNIWYNGVCRSQRPNGGFGAESCVEDGTIKILKGSNLYECFWCCTMRGGEGTTYASICSLCGEENLLQLLFYFDGKYSIPWIPGLTLNIRSEYPRTGNILIRIDEEAETPACVEWKIYMPNWVSEPICMINDVRSTYEIEDSFLRLSFIPKKGTEIRLLFDIPLFTMPVIGNMHKDSGLVTLRHGSLILATEQEETEIHMENLTYMGNGIYAEHDHIFKPLDDTYLMEEQQVKDTVYRILFQVV